MARAFFRPPTLGRRPLKTGNRKWAGFPRAGKPTSQVGVFEPLKNGPVFARAEMGPFFKGWIPADFHKTQIAHSTQLEGSNPQSEGAYGKSVFSPPDPGTAPPENRKPEMGWFSKGWKTDFPSRGFRAFEKGAHFRTCPIEVRLARKKCILPCHNSEMVLQNAANTRV